MINTLSNAPVSALRQRMIEDMNMRRFARKTQFGYVRHVARFATYLGRPPDTATVDACKARYKMGPTTGLKTGQSD
jgi:integrase/recombinase XerD